jgi:hypothetical protein
MGATGAGATGTGCVVTGAGENAGAGVVTIGGAIPCAYGCPGVTITPGVVAGGGTVVRKNGLVVGCAVRQLASVAAVRMTAQYRFIGQTPFHSRLRPAN